MSFNKVSPQKQSVSTTTNAMSLSSSRSQIPAADLSASVAALSAAGSALETETKLEDALSTIRMLTRQVVAAEDQAHHLRAQFEIVRRECDAKNEEIHKLRCREEKLTRELDELFKRQRTDGQQSHVLDHLSSVTLQLEEAIKSSGALNTTIAEQLDAQRKTVETLVSMKRDREEDLHQKLLLLSAKLEMEEMRKEAVTNERQMEHSIHSLDSQRLATLMGDYESLIRSFHAVEAENRLLKSHMLSSASSQHASILSNNKSSQQTSQQQQQTQQNQQQEKSMLLGKSGSSRLSSAMSTPRLTSGSSGGGGGIVNGTLTSSISASHYHVEMRPLSAVPKHGSYSGASSGTTPRLGVKGTKAAALAIAAGRRV